MREMTAAPVWELCFSGPGSGRDNMVVDEDFFAAYKPVRDRPRLRFYEWSAPCVTVGYSVRANSPLPDGLLRPEVEVARRPTGGGSVFHDRDLAFSIVLPARFFGGLRDCYAVLGKIIIAGISDTYGISGLEIASDSDKTVGGWCFAGPDRYDIVWRGRKLCGLAQRRKRDKIMFQGSICTTLWRPESFFPAPERAPFSPRFSVGLDEIAGRAAGAQELADAIASGFSAQIGIQFQTTE